jgi:hypothetical protein
MSVAVKVVEQSGLRDTDVFPNADAPDLAAVYQLIGGVAANVEHRGQLRNGEDKGKILRITVCVHGMYLQIKIRNSG